MCGIAGIVRFGGTVSEAELMLMNRAQHHRGPDGEGVHIDGGVGLAHTRLAIIDPKGGYQPFLSDDGRIALTFNGEIYNFKEIREELVAAGRSFTTTSDTEVLLESYRQWGIECLSRLRGMFAFGLYDRSERRLYLVRDRLGIKPLYYALDARRVRFGSEITSLITSPDVAREIDMTALAAFLRYQYVPAPLSIYRDVRKLQPGHYLALDVDSGSHEDRTYWVLEDVVREPATIEELDALLDETASIYVRSDVPFGAFLSGGVDSSLVTAYMARHLGEPAATFSIGYEEERHSELRFAAQASETLGTNHHAKVVSPWLAEESLELLVRHLGEPFGDSSAVPTYQVSRLAADHVKMVLSGDGGDELFAGYDSYATVFAATHDPLSRARSVLFGLASALPVGQRYRCALARRARRPQQLQDEGREIFTETEINALMNGGPEYRHAFDPLPRNADGVVTALQRQDMHTYLVDDVLTKVDRMSMACSLEVRVPILDHKIVEAAFSMPLSLKLRRDDRNGFVTKYALKQAGGRFFAQEFLERKKMGFGIPVHEWLAGALATTLDRELRDPANPIFGYIDNRAVADLLDRFKNGGTGLAPKLWSLLMLSMWMRIVHQEGPARG